MRISARLAMIEKAAAARQHERVSVVYADGNKAHLPLHDVIPLLLEEPAPVEIIGDGGEGAGQLAALIRALLQPCPERGTA